MFRTSSIDSFFYDQLNSSVISDENIHKEIMEKFLCQSCIENLSAKISLPICHKCGILIPEKKRICDACSNYPPAFRISRSWGIYGHLLQELIHLYKYSGKIQLSKPFGVLLFLCFIQNWELNDIDIIAPVPLHKKRFRYRGFNQSYLLVKNWSLISEKLGIDISHIKIEKKALTRIRNTKPQITMDKHNREKNVKDAFSVTDPDQIKGKKILIIDDVFTTGSTANECAKVLLQNKAQYVDVLTLARVT
ncbi:MAG: ComF family protein [Desulfobacterales bacterium]|nr:ComF family protein [Desulfobacterales bacterium]